MTNLNRTRTLTFRMNGATVTVRFPDADLAERLGAVYASVRAERSEGREPDIVVRRTPRGYALDGAAASQSRPSADELLPAFEWALTLALLDRVPGHVHLHASGVVHRTQALLALGATGAGKSTLALHWSCRGVPVLGDDTVLLDAAGRAHPFRRLFKLDPAVVTRAGLSLARTPWWVSGSTEAWYDPAEGAGWAEAAPVAVVALLDRVRNGSGAVRDLSRAEGLAALLTSCQSTGRTGMDALDSLVHVATSARFVALRYERSEAAAAGLLELLS